MSLALVGNLREAGIGTLTWRTSAWSGTPPGR